MGYLPIENSDLFGSAVGDWDQRNGYEVSRQQCGLGEGRERVENPEGDAENVGEAV